MVKIFIGSSLQPLFINLRKELGEALESQGFYPIMWEQSRPAGSTILDGELQMIKDSDVCVFLLGSEFSQGTLNEYNFSKMNKKRIILVDMTTAESKTNAEMNSTLKKEIWEVERKQKRITISWVSSRTIALQIKNGIITRFPEVKGISDNQLIDLKKVQCDIIEELKRIETKGVNRMIGVASPSNYRDDFFDFSDPERFFKSLYENGYGCLPSHGGNPEYGPKQLFYVDTNDRGRIGTYSNGSVFSVLTICRDRYMINNENYLPSVNIFVYIFNFIFFLKSMFEKVQYDGFFILDIMIDQCEGKQLAIDRNLDFYSGTPRPCQFSTINIKRNLNLEDLKVQEQLMDVTRNIIQELLGYFHYSPKVVSIIESKAKKYRWISLR